MFSPVHAGTFYLSRKDLDEGRSVKVWYMAEGIKRGWHCTPVTAGKEEEHGYPLSPDLWDFLYTEEELRAGKDTRRELSREHSGYTK